MLARFFMCVVRYLQPFSMDRLLWCAACCRLSVVLWRLESLRLLLGSYIRAWRMGLGFERLEQAQKIYTFTVTTDWVTCFRCSVVHRFAGIFFRWTLYHCSTAVRIFAAPIPLILCFSYICITFSGCQVVRIYISVVGKMGVPWTVSKLQNLINCWSGEAMLLSVF